MTNLFASSRCRTCYRGRRQDPAWRRTRFRTLLPFLINISPDAYKKAEEHQAISLLEKTSLEDDGPLLDKFKLGFSDDIRIYRALTRSERWSFDEEWKAFARNNTHSPFLTTGKPEGHPTVKCRRPQPCSSATHSPTQATEPIAHCSSLTPSLPIAS